MAGESQATQAVEDGRDNETTPLLGQTSKPQADATPGPNREDDGDRSSSDSFEQINDYVKTLRRRRWISLVASIFLIVAFIVVLILSGGECLSVSRDRMFWLFF
jgi:endothelin-converting enzyme